MSVISPQLTFPIVAVLVCLSSGHAFAQGSDSAKVGGDHSALLAQIITGWRELEQIDDEVKSCRVHWIYNSFGNINRLEARLGMREQVQFFSAEEPKSTKRMLYASSPSYGFMISQANPAESNWVLQMMLTPEQLSDSKMHFTESHPLRMRMLCFQPLSAAGNGGDRLASRAEFMRFTIDRVESEDGNLLVISYRANGSSGNQIAERGRIVLDKAASYCPIEFSRRSTKQPEILIEQKRTLVSKQPIRCGSFTHRTTRRSELETELTITFSDYSDRPPTDEELTLSHYGLPEPVGIALPPKRTPRYVWFLIGAAAFGVFALALRYFTRRRASRVGRRVNASNCLGIPVKPV